MSNKEKKNGHLEKQMFHSFWIIQNNGAFDWVMCSNQFMWSLKHSGVLLIQLTLLHSLNIYWPPSLCLTSSSSTKSTKNMCLWECKEWEDLKKYGFWPAHPESESPSMKRISSTHWAPHLYNVGRIMSCRLYDTGLWWAYMEEII